MGVIKKILYRSEVLGKPRHRNLFLDMEENIHIHYRDLRIEMSRLEFEEFSKIFAKQSKELQSIIDDKQYEDGKFANANQDDVRIFTESRLKNEVKYHPTRFSLEECGDGYHFHYRNYKLLIDEEEFHQIASLFSKLNLHGPFAATYTEVQELLLANDIDFMPDTGNIEGKVLALAVAKHHMPKIRDIFKYIGFAVEEAGDERIYTSEQLKVIARPDVRFTAIDYKRMRGADNTVRLIDFLTLNCAKLGANQINQIKCQVLDLYSALAAGKVLYVDLDPYMWLVAPSSNKVIFPYNVIAQEGKAKAEFLYRDWSQLLKRLELNFIKPDKLVFSLDIQKMLLGQIEAAIRRDIAGYACVHRIYTMGSFGRLDMGRYQSPFVHGKMVKLGSDIDILVEVYADREGDIPAHWTLHLPEASNHCAVYHITQIPIDGGFDSARAMYPNVTFTEHLIDAFVHLPSRGQAETKEAFLKKHGAKLFYDRDRDGRVPAGSVTEEIANDLLSIYGLQNAMVEKMKVSTENEIYKVFVPGKEHILKLFKVSGNYHRSRVAEHVQYEEKLIEQLKRRDIQTPGILPTVSGTEAKIKGFPALLFDRVSGVVNQKPEYPIAEVAAALAKIHAVQLKEVLDVESKFLFDDVCMMWLPHFGPYSARSEIGAELATCFSRLLPYAEYFSPGDNRAALYATSPLVHLHGDVTPKNVITDASGASVFFDFNNAYFGPRICDVIDGAIEFSLAEKYIHLADFKRFSLFFEAYQRVNKLLESETANQLAWTRLIGIIKFIKEVRVFLERPAEKLRYKRAIAISDFLVSLDKNLVP